MSGRGRKAIRGVSSGSSASTVPEPTARASTAARSRWMRRSATAPVSRIGAPPPGATLPSALRAAFMRHVGPAAGDAGQERRVQAASPPCSSTPTMTSSAVLPQDARCPRPLTSGVGILHRQHGPARSRPRPPPARTVRCGRCGCTARACSRASRRARAPRRQRARRPRRAVRPRPRANRARPRRPRRPR